MGPGHQDKLKEQADTFQAILSTLLEDYEKVDSFLKGSSPDSQLKVEIHENGVVHSSDSGVHVWQQDFLRFKALMDLIRMAREIATHYDINPPFPTISDLSTKYAYTIFMLHEFLHGRYFTIPTPSMRLSFTADKTFGNTKNDGSDATTINPEKQEFDFLGQSIFISDLTYTFQGAQLSNIEKVRGQNETRYFFEGTKTASLTITPNTNTVVTSSKGFD